MKEKTITIKVSVTNQGQWANLLLELNILKRAWKPFGVDMNIKAPGLKNVLLWGTRSGYNSSDRRAISTLNNKRKLR
jgi:hypothetical protein